MQPPTTTESTSTESVPGWFGENKSMHVDPLQPRNSHRKSLIIGGVILTVIIIGGGLASMMTRKTSSTCLNANDYETLSGITLDTETASTLSAHDFYSDYVAFKDASAVIDGSDDAADHGAGFIQKIATFYTQRHTVPMHIVINSTYADTSNITLAGQRIATVQSLLIDAGIPANVITMNSPQRLDPDEEETASDNGVSASDIQTNITITTTSICQ